LVALVSCGDANPFLSCVKTFLNEGIIVTFPYICAISLIVVLFAPLASAQPLTFSREEHPSNAGARAVTTADFDGNGWPDLAQANAGRNTVTLLLNRVNGGDGFTAAYDVPAGVGPFDIVSADFNHDDVPDLAVANADSNTITVLIGRRGGGFARTSTLAAPGNPRGITAADLNRDGHIDIAYTRYQHRAFEILFMDGNGGWSGGSVFGRTVGAEPQGVAAADFNLDGFVDLAFASVSSTGLTIYYQGTPGSIRGFASVPSLNVVTAADLNRDGWPDIAAASSGSNRVAVFLGGPSGMTLAATYATGASPRGIQTADANHDGALDVITANRNSNTVSVLLGRPNTPGSFDAAIEVASDRGSRGVVAADFNLDGRTDLATGNELAATATVLSNVTALVPAAYAFARIALPRPPDDDGLALADMNRNGHLDYVFADRVVLDGTSVVMMPVKGRGKPAIDDFNRDGRPDAALPSSDRRKVFVLAGNGAGRVTLASTIETSNAAAVVAAHMNADGIADLVVADFQTLKVYTGNGDATFTLAASRASDGPVNQVVDVNRDGKQDVVTILTRFQQPSTVTFHVGDGAGGFSGTQQHDIPGTVSTVRVADINHDGVADLVLGMSSTAILGRMLGEPEGGFGPVADFATTRIPGNFASADRFELADLTHDGNLDAVFSSLVPGLSDGSFAAPAEFAFGFNGDTAYADVNGDGITDIVRADFEPIGRSTGFDDPMEKVAYVLLNRRTDENRAPTAHAGGDRTMSYFSIHDDDETAFLWAGNSFDFDHHALAFEWRNASGDLLRRGMGYRPFDLAPGVHEIHLTVSDGRGGESHDTMTLTIIGIPEIVFDVEPPGCCGAWQVATDPTASDERRAHHPNRNAAKLAAPLASPTHYIDIDFIADPTQEYKLWVRMKAENNFWGNDSVFVQLSGGVDRNGATYSIGSTSGLAVNLEECSGCGVSEWGWRDERWGASLTGAPVLLRFPEGGVQRLRIQTREDGVSVDQIVLSSEQFKSASPGRAKNDTTILQQRMF
jgi:hypothetical protein